MTWISNSVGYVIQLVSLSDFVTFSLTKIPPCVFTKFLKLSLDAAIKKEFRLDQIFTKFSSNQIVLTEKTNIWLCDIFFSVLTKFFDFWPWVTKKAYAQGKKISSNCGGVTSSNLSSPFTAVHLQIFSWTFVCQGPFITALQLLNWLAIDQGYFTQVSSNLIPMHCLAFTWPSFV